MRYLKLYEHFILESVLTSDEIYAKYYSDIDRNEFDKIVKSDPTSKSNKVGKYSKWLLNLYKNNNLKLEDLYKATEYLTAFNLHQHKLPIKDINSIKSLPKLFNLVEPYIEKEEFTFSNDEERKLANQFKEIFRNNKYRIIIPLTLEASKYFGRNTEWCTTNTNMFKKYTKKQNPNNLDRNCLFILYTEDLKNRLQFHFKSRQFMDVKDSKIDINQFFDTNQDIYNFFNNFLDVNNYLTSNDIEWTKSTLEGAPQIVEGDFNCRFNQLTSLEGAPQIVEGDFNCSYNQLTSLEGAPQTVEGSFYCNYNNLTSLEGAPQIVEGDFNCRFNQLTSLEGAPQIVECGFYCSDNKLTSLKGAPQTVEGNFDCNVNKLTSLEGAPQTVEGDFYCSYNPNLSKDEILKYKNTGAVKGKIFSDYGVF
jgi:hypothetical protein